MKIEDYKSFVERIPFGKRLPTALYVFRTDDRTFGEALDSLLSLLIKNNEISTAFNIIKFRTNELKVSFLSYPDFLSDAHPVLRHAVTIDLVTGKVRHSDYAGNLNPPILHRKENFLPMDHPRRAEFEALTRAEETAGLYAETTTIGFKLNWERLLAAKGVEICGHSLRRREEVGEPEYRGGPVIDRHKTAMTRYDLSKPVKTLLEYGLLKPGVSFFDYGCGQGADVRGLQALGYAAEGWDPVHRRAVAKQAADVVNMGYVLNVIEDPVERVEALVDAFRHAKRLLVVSGLIAESVEAGARFRDGIVTQRNTFQKYFEQQELQQYVEDALETTAVPVALGVFYVFREPAEQQDFLSARNRRAIDWTQISARLGLGGPQGRWETLYKEHKEMLDAFGKLAFELGRIPGSDEFQDLNALCGKVGSAKRALRTFVQGGGAQGITWPEVCVRFGIGQPVRPRWEVLYEENQNLLDAYWGLMLQLGRMPTPEEFSRFAELHEKIGSPKRAMKLFIQRGGGAELQRAADDRQKDLLVYVAMANLRKRVPFGHLSANLRVDIRTFFRNYTRALEKGLELLYASGDSGEIEVAFEGLKIGWQDEQALFLHRSLLERLPPVLRAYVGCATALFGDVAQADLIKLHKTSGKVTFLVYDDFEGNPLPELRQRIKVNLRTRWVQVFDHSADGQLLYFKERYLAADHPAWAEMEKFSGKVRKLIFDEKTNARGPSKLELATLLENTGLNENLNPRRVFLDKDQTVK